MQLPYRKPGKYSQTQNDPMMTEDKFRELERDLLRLKEKQPKAAAEVARLAELGDFSENVEYQLAKGRLRGINDAILKIDYQINHAEIIAPKKGSTVTVGSTVTIESKGKQKTYQILGSSETNPSKGIISHTSPIGAALLGKAVGDTVCLVIHGSEKTSTIVHIA